jgi:hypothetical protein
MNNRKLAKQLCIQMNIEWDDNAECATVDNHPITNADIYDAFHQISNIDSSHQKYLNPSLLKYEK